MFFVIQIILKTRAAHAFKHIYDRSNMIFSRSFVQNQSKLAIPFKLVKKTGNRERLYSIVLLRKPTRTAV